jgi:hypothetical protein
LLEPAIMLSPIVADASSVSVISRFIFSSATTVMLSGNVASTLIDVVISVKFPPVTIMVAST